MKDPDGTMTSSSKPIDDKAYIKDINTSYGNPVKIVDLFAGIGGFHYGIAAAANEKGRSVEPLLVSEIEESCRKIYVDNHGFRDRQVGDINGIELKNLKGEADVVTAGFPCQPFSNSGLKRGLTDPRGQFYEKIKDIILRYSAKSFILENVPGIRTNGQPGFTSRLAADGPLNIGSTMNHLEERLGEDLWNYKVKWLEIDSSDLGSPQARKRVYIIGIRNDFLEKFKGDFEIKLNTFMQNDFFHIARREDDRDSTLKLSSQQEANIRSGMSTKPSFHNGMRRVGKAYLCPGGNVGQAYHADGLVPTLTKVWARFLPIYFPSDSEVRPEVDKNRTEIREFEICENYREGFIRRASVEEVMRLQGFPKSFKPHQTPRIAYEHAGNAVNAKVIREIADNLFRYIL
jgi:DNA-cytosine methyltransferase